LAAINSGLKWNYGLKNGKFNRIIFDRKAVSTRLIFLIAFLNDQSTPQYSSVVAVGGCQQG